jgi:acyl-CoA reductase-like NAD-dependent aldehyde dehydrogenase
MTGFDRARLLRSLATILERDADALAALETRDTGKLLREMGAQARYLPQWFHYFAGAADKIQGATIPSDRRSFFVYTRHQPVGVVAAIVPWNSPLLLLAWKLAPALAAGCTVVVKPSDYSPVTALELAKRVEAAGFPAGVFNVVIGNGPEVGRALARHPGRRQGRLHRFDADRHRRDGVYGLAAGVWTLDVHRAHRVAARVRAGSVWINAYRVVAPNVSFGGFGASSIGRENGLDAIREFTETKAVWVELTGATRDPFTMG